MAALFPLFLKVEGRKCVIVGAGSIAAQKVGSLLDSGANVRVVAPEANEHIQELARSGRVDWVQAEFKPEHLSEALLVIAATGYPVVNEQVYRAAVAKGILCNSVDEPERCDFYYGAVVKRGDLQIAISTAGKSPALAQRIRKELEDQFDSNYIVWLDWLGSVRELLFQRHVEPKVRKQTLHRISRRTVFERFKSFRELKGHHG